MAFYSFLYLCRVHFADLMEQLICLCLESCHHIALRHDSICRLRLLHQSIIINRYQPVTVTDISPCAIIKRDYFQILHDFVDRFFDTDTGIVIYAAVYFLIIQAHNGIVIAALCFLDADVTVCYLKGKLCFLRFCLFRLQIILLCRLIDIVSGSFLSAP